MNNEHPACGRLLRLGAFILWFSLARVTAAAPPDLTPPGFRPVPPGVHALVGAKVVVKPGVVLEPATIVIRDGFIQAVGKDAAVPPDARVWDMKGLTVYAGFIDPLLTLGPKAAGRPATTPEPDDLTGGGVRFFGVTELPRDAESTGPGYEIARIAPERRVARNFSPDPKALEKLREIGFTAGSVSPEKGILRGTSAFAALGEADANHAIIKPDVFQHVCFETEGGRGGGYPGSLMGIIAAVRQTFFDAQHYVADQADDQQHPQDRPRPAYNLALEALAPVVQRKIPVLFEPKDALMVDRAARVARELNLDYCLVSSGQEWRRPALAKAAGAPFIVPLNFPLAPKLPSEDDWDQVTLDELRAWDWAPENAALLRRQGIEIALTTYGLEDKSDFRKNLRLALDRGLSETDALAALTTVPARLCGLEYLLGTVQTGKQANLTVVDGKGYFDPEAKVRSVWIDGRFYRVPPEGDKEETKPAPDPKKEVTTRASKSGEEKKPTAAERRLARQKELAKRIARSPLEGRGPIASPPVLLVRHATIWTSAAAGILTNTDLLVVHGKIASIGRDLLKEGLVSGHPPMEVDATGLSLTAGLIDCHSHSMILGGVNEGSLPSSAMVRIGDVVNSETPNIYEQLAGGVTTVNLLHGSANPIGGQNCVIKLRDGDAPENLKFRGAPEGIKFALGENVKQSNRAERTAARYPQTRMGVGTFIAHRFTAARQYLQSWEEYRKNGGPPPRRDLELEAIGEILQGTRLIHCHSYRQDEILMLIRMMDGFGVKIATFQHVLEGYKVADEIAKHGAGGSTFSDWWAYKFEVYDAIPYNGSLMHDRGVVVSFNSDSDDLARRLYLEAAKAVKYGGTPEEEALDFVTINPAKQLHLDGRIGSIEPGKDADFVLWSRSPLDSSTVCLQTWVDGKKRFDRALAPARSEALAKERTDLIAKAKKAAAPSGRPERSESADSGDNSFFQQSLEHLYDGRTRHCEDLDEN